MEFLLNNKLNLKKKLNSRIGRYLISFLLGGTYVLAFAPFNLFPLFFISLLGMFYLFNSIESLKEAILNIFCFSASICIFGLYWIFYGIQYIIVSLPLSLLVFIGFILLYTSLLLIPFVVLFLFHKQHIITKTIFFVISLVIYEFIKIYAFGGFPWFIAASIWDFNLKMLQIVSIIGVFNYSIITYTVLGMLCIIFLNTNIKPRISLTLIIIVLITGLYYYGHLRMKEEEPDTLFSFDIKIIQPNIPQEDKLNYAKLHDIFTKTLELIEKDLNYDNPPKYIILPEVAFNVILDDSPRLKERLYKAIPKGSYLLLGTINEIDDKIYNSFEILTSDIDKKFPIYHKIKLVPFGEKIPFSEHFPLLMSKIGLQSFAKGEEQVIYQVDLQDKFSVLICFEGIFSYKALNSSNIDWILNISNESWFKKSIEQKQNISLLRFRAIEGGVPVVKVSNSGISGVFNYKGEQIYQLSPLKTEIKNITLKIKTKPNTIVTKGSLNTIG